MNTVISEQIDDCVRIRLSRGDTNALTTDVIQAVTGALDAAEHSARGIMLCGGDKFFSNGVDLEWALTQSGAQMRDALGLVRESATKTAPIEAFGFFSKRAYLERPPARDADSASPPSTCFPDTRAAAERALLSARGQFSGRRSTIAQNRKMPVRRSELFS